MAVSGVGKGTNVTKHIQGKHKSQMGYWRPRIVKGPINPRALAVHSPRRKAARRKARKAREAELQAKRAQRILDVLLGRK